MKKKGRNYKRTTTKRFCIKSSERSFEIPRAAFFCKHVNMCGSVLFSNTNNKQNNWWIPFLFTLQYVCIVNFPILRSFHSLMKGPHCSLDLKMNCAQTMKLKKLRIKKMDEKKNEREKGGKKLTQYDLNIENSH